MTETLHLSIEVREGFTLSLLTFLATDPRIEAIELRQPEGSS